MPSIDITILGGLSVTIEATVCRAEPDVGIRRSYVDEWYISAVAGKLCKKAPSWLYNRINKTKGEEERILDSLHEKLYD